MANKVENQPVDVPKKGFFKNIFHHPNFNVVCGIITIVSLILSILFYMETIKEPNLTYYISSTRTPIVDTLILTNLSVSYEGIPIKGNLSAQEIQIWNSGKQPIRREDILQPISIKTQNGEPIYGIRYSPTREAIGFNWINYTHKQSGLLEMDWKILEQNDGVKIQIIYGGSVNLPIIIDGVIAGQPKGITRLILAQHGLSDEDIFVMFLGILLLLLSLKSIRKQVMNGAILNKEGKRTWGYIMYLLFSLFYLITLIGCLIVLFFNIPIVIRPPFGF